MRFSYVLFAVSIGLLPPGLARAQTTPPFSCSGANAPTTDLITLAIKTGAATPTPINYLAVTAVLDMAECLCNSTDLYVEPHITKGIPQQMIQFSIWAGSSCNATTRNTSCELVNTGKDVNVQDFWMGGNNGYVYQPVPVRSVIQPAYTGQTTPHMCSGTTTNGLWFLFGDLSAPDYCTVRLDAVLTPPDPPTIISADSGDSAVNVTWQAPPTGSALPTHYQVLCAQQGDKATDVGIPLAGEGAYAFGESNTNLHQLGYSTCTTKGLQRRSNLATNGSTPSTDDAGTTTTVMDLGTASFGGGGNIGTEDVPPDMSVTTTTGTDGGTAPAATTTTGTGHFPNLDKAYVCSDVLTSSTSQARITKLTNGQPYWFLVVGIDDHGNPVSSKEISQTPQPVEDFYRRYTDSGGKAQGFCFIATAAYGSYQHPYVRVLREFRDRALLTNEAGGAFVAWYYRTSPPYAAFIGRHQVARFVVRLLLWPLIGFAWLWLAVGGVGAMLLLAGAVAVILQRRRLRALLGSGSASASASDGPAPAPVRSEA